MISYTTKEKVQNYLVVDIDVSLDDSIDSYIEAMSTHIDYLAGYPVFQDTPTTQKYDGNGRRELSIAPVHTITEITVDDVVKTPTQYPYNDDIKTSLIFKTDYFPKDIANVSVTGKHCLSKTLPSDIEYAATVFVALIITQLKEGRQGVSSEKIGEYSVSFKSEKERLDYETARNIVMSYRRLSF